MRKIYCVVWDTPTIKSYEARFLGKGYFNRKNGYTQEQQNLINQLGVGGCVTLANNFVFITRIR